MALSGNLSKAVQATKTSSSPSGGSVTRGLLRTLTGELTSSGSQTTSLGRALSGQVGLSGALALLRVFLRDFAGSLGTSGSLVQRLSRQLVSTGPCSGVLLKSVEWGLVASLPLSGAVNVVRLAALYLVTLAGTLAPSGAVVKGLSRVFAATLAPTGAVIKGITHVFAGLIALAGALASTVFPPVVPGVGEAIHMMAPLVRRLRLLGVREDGTTEGQDQRRRKGLPWWVRRKHPAQR